MSDPEQEMRYARNGGYSESDDKSLKLVSPERMGSKE